MTAQPSIPADRRAGSGEQQAADRSAVVGQAQEKARDLAEQAQTQAQLATEQAKNHLREQLDQRSSQAAERINEQALDLRSVSEVLRQQGNAGSAKAADRLAAYAEKVGGYLREKDSEALLADAEDFGRRQPWAVGAGAVALGFAAARFLKASSHERYSARRAYPQPAKPAARRVEPLQDRSSYGGAAGV
jgi:hypothetical protein